MHIRTPFPGLSAIAILLLPAWAVAAESVAPDVGSSLLQLVLGFLLVLGLLFATLWLLKKISVPRGATGGVIRVVSGAAVGPRERVVVVDVVGKRLVVGVAPGSVSLLSEQPLPPEAEPLGAPTGGNAAIPEFARWLQRTLDRRDAK